MTPFKNKIKRREYHRQHYHKRTEGKVKRRDELVPVDIKFIDYVIDLGFDRGHKTQANISRAIGLKSTFLSDTTYRLTTYDKFSIQKCHYQLILDWIKNGKTKETQDLHCKPDDRDRRS